MDTPFLRVSGYSDVVRRFLPGERNTNLFPISAILLLPYKLLEPLALQDAERDI